MLTNSEKDLPLKRLRENEYHTEISIWIKTTSQGIDLQELESVELSNLRKIFPDIALIRRESSVEAISGGCIKSRKLTFLVYIKGKSF